MNTAAAPIAQLYRMLLKELMMTIKAAKNVLVLVQFGRSTPCY
jgi:hypothetical protein